MEQAESLIRDWLPLLVTALVFFGILSFANWALFKRVQGQTQENLFPRQLLMLLLCLVTVVAIVISLPIKESTESQVLGLIGLVISGLLAFSSTTIVGNLVAGTMMRFTQPFRTGDYIRVEQFAGRVTERGLFDCEIQTEQRELIAVPNNYFIAHPVTVVRSSGTIISVSLSLGYDLHHSQINELLKQAAEQSGLQDPFVHITELGNFSVTYKVSGMLLEVKNLLTARSRLFSHVLDVLHEQDIEVMSPSFMNQRKMPEDHRAVPRKPRMHTNSDLTVAEDIVFDKAEEAEQVEKQKQTIAQRINDVKAAIAETDGEEKAALEVELEKLIEQQKQVVDAAKEVSKEDQ